MTHYHTDFYAWSREQAECLKARQREQLDTENLAEEIESLRRQERQQMINRFEVLLGHQCYCEILLK